MKEEYLEDINFQKKKIPDVQLPSAQSLLCNMRFGEQNLSSGTGFILQNESRSFFLTNRHNLTGRRNDTNEPMSPTGGVPDNILIYHHVSNRPGAWQGRLEKLYDDEGKPLWREHPLYGSRADIAALPLTNVSGVDLYPYQLANNPRIAVAPGDVVSVVGFPFGMSTGGLLPIWATGFIASEPQVNLNNSDLPIFYIDCRSRPGQSGSAVIAHRTGGVVTMEGGVSTVFSGPITRLLGIYSGRVNPESDIGIVWKSSSLHGLIEDSKNNISMSLDLSPKRVNW